MLISIITSSYNHGHFIRDTIESVLQQNFSNIEHIVIDGGSNDNTIDILKSYSHLRWISEKDNGQTHAINKGLKMAKGEIVIWLNSDDYFENNVISQVMDFFENHPECNLYYGDLTYVNNQKKPLYKIVGETLSFNSLIRNPDLMREPAIFFRKRLVEEFGLLDESLHLVMDLDFFLRVCKKYPFYYAPINISYFRWDNHNKTVNMLDKQLIEMWHVLHRHKSPLPIASYKFLLGRYIDTLPSNSIVKKLFTKLRRKDSP
ncbi:MAG: glycosyltransferase [Ignavibacteriales bacterium]|nr:glycosyltransferase [Ignavibacteriales bacterium]